MVASKSSGVDIQVNGSVVDRDAVDRLQHVLGLSDREVICVLGLERCVSHGRRSGPATPERLPDDRLRELESLSNRLQESFEDDGLRRWLRIENRYLGGWRPVQLLMAGEFERVHASLDALDSGVFI